MKRVLLTSVLCLLAFTVSSLAETNSVERGLAWLASQQHPSGAWSTNTALNALPLLAFLSAGHVPEAIATGPARRYADNVDRGIRFLLAQQTPDGAFTGGGSMMYGHGISTLVLAEISGMTKRQTRVRIALDKSIGLILRAQVIPKNNFDDGGWRYRLDSTDSDLSVSVWQIAALKAASETGIAVPQESLQRAAAYIRRCEHPRGGFGYQPGGHPNQSRAAAGILALRLCGLPDDPAAVRARQWLAQNPLQWTSDYFYYAAHHCAHAGTAFDEKLLLEKQNFDGSWPAPPASRDELRAGPLYTTSMAILALTAQWDYLPVYLK